ncbi:MAG: VanZ family protein [Cytophagaceae bacterium]|jgi:VanZ family protein|nr:VanZ family protein [Cytophagaceae bacterium]
MSKPDFFAVEWFDLFAHFLMFSGFTFVFFTEKYRKSANQKDAFKFYLNCKYIFYAILLGFLIEVFQPILSTRSRELFDFFADVAGATAGYFVFNLFKKLFGK